MDERDRENKIELESNLEDLIKFIDEGRKKEKIKKRPPSGRIMGMLYRLRKEDDSYVPRQIRTVQDLYTFTEFEMLRRFNGYKKKTWLGLDKILQINGLPPLNLPQEYTSDS